MGGERAYGRGEGTWDKRGHMGGERTYGRREDIWEERGHMGVVSRDSDVINEILRLYANATFSCMSGGIPAEPMKFEISCDRT